MAVTTIDSNVVELQISTNLAVPAYLSMVCADTTRVSGTRSTNRRPTKCEVLLSAGEPEWTISGSGVASTTPAVDELSAEEIVTIFNSGADVLVKVTDGADYTRTGTGKIVSYNETADQGGVVEFDFEIAIKGDLALV